MKDFFKVEILGREYSIRSDEGEDKVKKIATYVDRKMRALSEGSKTVSTLNLAILVAMEIANDYFNALEGQNRMVDLIESKTNRLIDLINSQVMGKI